MSFEASRRNRALRGADTVTKPALSRAYADALSELEKRFRFTVVDGDHEIFLAEEVLSVATTAVEEVRSLREAK